VELLDGDYYVVATGERLKDWQTPDNLVELAKTATRISIAPGERKTEDISIRH
jgi:hypothetical protein